MTEGDALDLILDEHAAANQATLAAGTNCDSTYHGNYNNFVAWVKNQPLLETQVEPFITRVNVDHYFTRVVARKRGQKNTIRRILNALVWYAKNREHIGAKFVVTSNRVEQALVTQVAYNIMVGGTGRPGSDPHNGLKDILPVSEQIRIMTYIFKHRADWGPAAFSFTWGMNGAVRGASNRVFTYCDLNLSHGFGSEETGPLARALLLILRSGALHKDRQETANQVCAWRHKQWLLCSVFSTAMHVIWKLSQNTTISFLHADTSERAEWWDIPLIDWDLYSEASNSTKEIYKATGVKNCKVTHHRTASLQKAGFMGLTSQQINHLTNHIIDKQHQAYQSQAEWEVRFTVFNYFYVTNANFLSHCTEDLQRHGWASEMGANILCPTYVDSARE
jgi:hypothetical protein